ncbi:16S rRNA processing protein RimM [Clostridium sp. cel8]|uniref:ribosome maturation factor RimM n=1 Tax=unclassified Clostridium TaxID=2614128 RepID=UPI0015F389BB|nr:ribosome maturation factor RimM [Clostridium sp. cel8]MBA5850488.1 16S rRNA processing protein RimM [Clostridium sp. cel8]
MEEFITIGKIVNTHGIKGELKIYPLTDDLNRFKILKDVYIDGKFRKVLNCKLQSKRAVLKIEGINSIEDASLYKGKYIKVKREDAIELDKGSYYITDIIGCRVIDTDGVDCGIVSDVLHTPNNDVYWIKEGKELLIPALEGIVLNVDIEKSEILIKPVSTWMSE